MPEEISRVSALGKTGTLVVVWLVVPTDFRMTVSDRHWRDRGLQHAGPFKAIE